MSLPAYFYFDIKYQKKKKKYVLLLRLSICFCYTAQSYPANAVSLGVQWVQLPTVNVGKPVLPPLHTRIRYITPKKCMEAKTENRMCNQSRVSVVSNRSCL